MSGTTTRLCDVDFKGALKAMTPDFSFQHLRTVIDLRSVALEVELQRSQALEEEASLAETKAAYHKFHTGLHVDQATARALTARCEKAKAEENCRLTLLCQDLHNRAWDSIETFMASKFPVWLAKFQCNSFPVGSINPPQ